MELGAIVCTPTSPACLLCPVREHCVGYHEGVQNDLPVKTKNKKQKELHLAAIVLRDSENRTLIHKRPDKGLLANLWEFPNMEIVLPFQTEKETIRGNATIRIWSPDRDWENGRPTRTCFFTFNLEYPCV